MHPTSKYFAITAVLVICAGLIGYSLGQNYNNSSPNQTFRPTTETAPKANSFFATQTATFQGQISQVSGKQLTLKNAQGQTQQFPISDKIAIYKPKVGSNQASASSNLNLIETNQVVSIILDLQNGHYQVGSIYYPPTVTKK